MKTERLILMYFTSGNKKSGAVFLNFDNFYSLILPDNIVIYLSTLQRIGTAKERVKSSSSINQDSRPESGTSHIYSLILKCKFVNFY